MPIKKNKLIVRNNLVKIFKFLKIDGLVKKTYRILKYKVLNYGVDIDFKEIKKLKERMDIEVEGLSENTGLKDIIKIKNFDDGDPRALMEYWGNLYMISKLKK